MVIGHGGGLGFFSLAKNCQVLGADPYPYINHVLRGNACSGQEQAAVGFRHAASTSTQPATFATSGGRQVHARTNEEGQTKPQSCRVGEPFTTKQKVCGRDIQLQQIYHKVDARQIVILMELIRNGPPTATRL